MCLLGWGCGQKAESNNLCFYKWQTPQIHTTYNTLYTTLNIMVCTAVTITSLQQYCSHVNPRTRLTIIGANFILKGQCCVDGFINTSMDQRHKQVRNTASDWSTDSTQGISVLPVGA